jgi:hypothetical protein
LRALLAADEGRLQDSGDDIQLILRLAATLEREPALLSQLTRASLIRMAVRTTERSLSRKAVGLPSDLLMTTFAGATDTNSMRLALIGERAMAVPVFRMSWAEIERHGNSDESDSREGQRVPLAGRPNPVLWLTGFFERDLNFYLRAMDTNIALATLPAPASLLASNMAAHFSETANRRWYPVSGLVLPALSQATVRDAATVASIRIVQAGLAIERFRAAQGRLPDTLSELTPQYLATVPTDPFDGAPLRYQRSGKGCVIYSVDRDGHDDGGRERPLDFKSSDHTSYDLTFTVQQ